MGISYESLRRQCNKISMRPLCRFVFKPASKGELYYKPLDENGVMWSPGWRQLRYSAGINYGPTVYWLSKLDTSVTIKIRINCVKSDIVTCLLSNWGTPNDLFLKSAKNNYSIYLRLWKTGFLHLLPRLAIIRIKSTPTIFGFKNSDGNWYQKDFTISNF